MALKLYDKLTPSDSFPLVDAKDVEMPDGTRLSEFNPSVGEEVLKDIAALKAQDEVFMDAAELAVSGLTSIGIRLKALETPATSVNMTGFASDGMIIETRADGTTVEHRMAFDGSGVPVGLTTIMKDDKGEIVKESETELIGFGQMTYVSAEGESF